MLSDLAKSAQSTRPLAASIRTTLTSPCAVRTFTLHTGRRPASVFSTDNTRPLLTRCAAAAASSRLMSAQAGVASTMSRAHAGLTSAFMARRAGANHPSGIVLPSHRIHRHAHLQERPRVLAHQGGEVLPSVLVVDLVADDTRLNFIHRAARRHFSGNLFVLVPPVAVRDAVCSKGAHHRAHRRGGFPSVAPADLVAQQGTRHAADNGTTIVVPANAARLVDPLPVALFVGNVDALVLWIDAANAGIVDVGFGVSPDDRGRQQRDKGKAFHGGSFGWYERILPAPM